MDHNGTGWPVRHERRQQERLKLMRGAPSADFISQLIVERDRLPSGGGSVAGAVGAYAAAGRIAVRRMPAGYRKTVVA
jgi:hypothetical protein